MEQASSAFSTGVPALAAIPQLAGNSRQGFGLVDGTMRWASGWVISSNTLGLSTSLYDGDAGSRSTGKERDTESGNDYFEARYYSSAMGRFMSPDWAAQEEPVPYAQLDDPQSLNLYAYVRNNPLTRVDEDGHDGCCDFSIPVVESGPMPPLPNPAHPITPYSDEYSLTPEKLGAALDQLGYDLTHVPVLQSLKESVIGWFSKKDAPAKGPVKGADSATVTSNGQAATPSGEVRGGSGAPRGHSTTHSTKKGAKEAAAQSSKDGKVRNDANPKDGRGGHFHPNETDNKGSEHHYYPKKNNP
jgi:RHS repeat-associated protein